MKKTIFLILTALFVMGTTVVLLAQDSGERRRGPGATPGGGQRSGPGAAPGGGQRGGPGAAPGGGQRGGPGGGQRGGGGFGAPGAGPGGNWGGSGGPGQSPDRMIGMLRAMDTNSDGTLDPSEVPEYRRPFVSMMITRLGGDPTRPVSLADLERRASAGGGTGTPPAPSRQTDSTSQTTVALSADPLVPYFGEKEPSQSAVVGFGQREPQTRTTVYGAASSQTTSQSDQILRSAREIMNRYDRNRNGTLDKDSGEWNSSLPFNADVADTNRDGRISMTELVAALGGKSTGTMGNAVVSTRQSTAYDRLPPGVPSWFFERDKNQDAQLTMQEYANGQPWTEEMAGEFKFLDANNDGIVTIAEVYTALKKVDDEKRLKEEQARREQQRRSGGVVAAAPPAEGTPAPGTETPQPAGESVPASAPGTPTATAVAAPAENQPALRPAAPPSDAPAAIPQNAPYSSGSATASPRNRSGGAGNRGSSGPPSPRGR